LASDRVVRAGDSHVRRRVGPGRYLRFPGQIPLHRVGGSSRTRATGVTGTNRPAIPVSFFVWWLLTFLFMVGFRSRRAKQSAT